MLLRVILQTLHRAYSIWTEICACYLHVFALDQYFFYKLNKLVALAFKENCYHSGLKKHLYYSTKCMFLYGKTWQKKTSMVYLLAFVKIRPEMKRKAFNACHSKTYAIWTHLAEAFMHEPLNNYKGHFEEYLDINMCPVGLNCAQID